MVSSVQKYANGFWSFSWVGTRVDRCGHSWCRFTPGSKGSSRLCGACRTASLGLYHWWHLGNGAHSVRLSGWHRSILATTSRDCLVFERGGTESEEVSRWGSWRGSAGLLCASPTSLGRFILGEEEISLSSHFSCSPSTAGVGGSDWSFGRQVWVRTFLQTVPEVHLRGELCMARYYEVQEAWVGLSAFSGLGRAGNSNDFVMVCRVWSISRLEQSSWVYRCIYDWVGPILVSYAYQHCTNHGEVQFSPYHLY